MATRRRLSLWVVMARREKLLVVDGRDVLAHVEQGEGFVYNLYGFCSLVKVVFKSRRE